MQTLIIRHVAESDPPRFTVTRASDVKAIDPVEVPRPNSVRVEGRPNELLTNELRWYLETFLGWPFHPETDHAERVLEALRHWGKTAFNALFTPVAARREYEKAIDKGMPRLTVRIVSDDPVILGWPWEALEDPEVGQLALHCQIERRLDRVRDPHSTPEPPQDRVNILLVVARPYEGDVKYRSISRLMVELSEREQLPVSIDLLRPPTLDQLRKHLKDRPHYYHILHFDGHGSYRDEGQRDDPAHPGGGRVLFRSKEGHLVFETVDGKPDPIKASSLIELLRDHPIPAVVLNACQSAAVDEHAADPFASVAAALLKSGMRSVVAMAYALYVSGAQQFLPAFYRELFRSGSLAEATRAGRQQMFRQKNRVCAVGEHPLDDFLLPVLYQHEAPDFSFAKTAKIEHRPTRLPEEARDAANPYGFVGRDSALLELERAMHREPAGILITGLGGVGKTTLARGFLKWLDETNGLDGAYWFSFVGVLSTEFMFNRLGEAIFQNPQFATLDAAQKIELLAKALRDNRVVIVWDNFETVKGIPGTGITGNLSNEDANRLKEFLTRLRGGKTKVVITSRSTEDWLGITNRGKPIALAGLDGEERWEYANKIVHDLGLKFDRKQQEIAKLMDLLRGHPLAMRVLFTKLEKQTAEQLTKDLQSNFDALRASVSTDQEAMLFGTLRFATDALPEQWQPLLIPLSLHEGFVDGDYLAEMAEQVSVEMPAELVSEGLQSLTHAGLLRPVGQEIYELHPLLSGFLRSACSNRFSDEVVDAWERAFVEVMGSLADLLTPRPVHEQRFQFMLFESTFQAARQLASRKGMHSDSTALTQSLAAYAQNTYRFGLARDLFNELARQSGEHGQERGQAAAYHQLGNIAQERQDFTAAEEWYRKSLAIKERIGDRHGVGITYHQLGCAAQRRRDFATAEEWYRKSLAISESLKDEHGAATTYYQLGLIAQDRRDFAVAEEWHRKSLAIKERLGNLRGAALTYHALGTVALERRDFAAAEEWYRNALAIYAMQSDEHLVAMAHHQLGRVAEERQDVTAAEEWYRKSLTINESLKDEHGAAITYHQLGCVAQARWDFAAAEGWYRKSLAIKERFGDEYGAAQTCHQFGGIDQERGDFIAAWEWYLKSVVIFAKYQDQHSLGIVFGNLKRSFAAAPSETKLKLLALGSEWGLPEELLSAIQNAPPSTPPETPT